MNDAERPDPDALLRKVTDEAARARRARLTIFFGFAPGVGKTFAMLASARARAAEGADVVVGCVETHGRVETARRLEGLEIIPRRLVAHRGVMLEELDLDRVLARRPEIVLVDELAHTNAPALRHAKRWQDVLDLLDAGIHVHTTLNVQHVESLNDVVAQITGVTVRETVPDAVLDRADAIELVDLPPEVLLARLRDGKVYAGDQAARAARSFFQRGNLLALRELALRRTAEHVDADVLAYREANDIAKTWPAGERILVCVSASPASARLVRAARRMASGLRAQLVAAYVEPVETTRVTDADRARLEANLRLAESLGAEVVRLVGARVSETILEHARKHNVTRIVVGKPTHGRLRDRIRGSLLDEIVRGSGDIDVHVISGDATGAPARPAPVEDARAAPPEPTAYVSALALVALGTSVAWLGRATFAMPDLAMVYLLVIIVVAVRLGRGPSFLASAASIAAFDFFFVPPYFTFAVTDVRHVFTFAMLFGVATLLSTLTLRLRRQELDARARETRTATLYALSRELGSAVDARAAAAVLARHAADVFRSGAAVFLASSSRTDGALEAAASSGVIALDAPALGVCRWVLEHGRAAGRGTDTLPGAPVLCVPIGTETRTVGALALATADERARSRPERDFLDAFVRPCALAIERARLAEAAKAAELRVRDEAMRSSLLSAVSHDLRTPLAAITGAITTLRDRTAPLDPAQRGDLEEAIQEEAERLERLLANLLEMTRLEAGGVHVRREWIPLDEIIGAALGRLDDALGERAITLDLSRAPRLVPVDPILLEQVFVNLFENAAKYTPRGTPLDIEAFATGDADARAEVVILVQDRGAGIPEEALAHVFEKFHRGAHPGVGGVGLGLPICRGIVEAHGGSIVAEPRGGGGSCFRIRLPIVGTPPVIEADSSEGRT